MIIDRECAQCGAAFWGGPRAYYCPRCRSERRQAYSKNTRRWSDGDVVAAIRQRRDAGLALNAASVQRDCWALLGAAKRRFGSWDAALVAAGIDPTDIRSRRTWTAEAVIAAILKRSAQGEPVYLCAVLRDDTGLCHAAKRIFGSWAGALTASGLDPEEARNRYRKTTRSEAWYPAQVVGRIRTDAAAGLDMSTAAVQRRQSSLVSQAVYYFGSWGAACEAAGLDYESIRKGPRRRKYKPNGDTPGARVHRRRIELGMTAHDLAVLIERSDTYVAHIERDRRGISDEAKARLIEALKCSADDLFVADPEKPASQNDAGAPVENPPD